MATHDNIATVKRAYEAFKRGDIQAVLEDMAEDVVWTTPGPKDVVPFVGQVKGRAAVAKFFEALAASEYVFFFDPREFIAEGDSVAVSLFYRARVKATGRTYEGEGIHLFHFRNSKVASFKEYADTARMASAYKAT